MPINLPESFSQNPQGAEIGLWPFAWGWWVLLTVSLIALVSLCFWLVARYKKRKALREALKTLGTLQNDADNILAQCNKIIKRVFISYFSPAHVASLHGASWTDFLKLQIKANKKSRFEALFQALDSGLYQRSGQQSIAIEIDVIQLTTKYLKQALPPGKKQLRNAEVSHD
ncbi:DUF4381 domain-containing protein [Planctobacterium marinum]